jgi:hypothetical protein
MPTYEIEHTWDANQTNAVVGKVQEAVRLASAGKVPAGFTPLTIYAIPGETRARCVWEAPGSKELEALYAQLGVPTRRTIRQVNSFYRRP